LIAINTADKCRRVWSLGEAMETQQKPGERFNLEAKTALYPPKLCQKKLELLGIARDSPHLQSGIISGLGSSKGPRDPF
jgi:hypothetical protein